MLTAPHVGSVVLLTLLLPYTSYSGDQSPFVTVMDKLGIPGAAGVMNLVVLTAALFPGTGDGPRGIISARAVRVDGECRSRRSDA